MAPNRNVWDLPGNVRSPTGGPGHRAPEQLCGPPLAPLLAHGHHTCYAGPDWPELLLGHWSNLPTSAAEPYLSREQAWTNGRGTGRGWPRPQGTRSTPTASDH